MIVTSSTFQTVLKEIEQWPVFSLDTETTGLYAYKEDKLFSIIISNGAQTYYFNFQKYAGKGPEFDDFVLDRSFIKEFQKLFTWEKLVFLANAKFDMAMMWREGIDMRESRIWDVLVAARLIRNDFMKYDLASVAERTGLAKSKEVDEFIKKHRVYSYITIPGKKSRVRAYHFDKVPFDIIRPYAEKDAEITFHIGAKQMFFIENGNETRVQEIMENECELTAVCFDMESVGIKLDLEYCNDAIFAGEADLVRLQKEFAEETMHELIDSNKYLSAVFEKLQIKGGTTEKGNASFTDTVLAKINHPVAQKIRDFRDARKRLNSYFKSFVFYADGNSVVHPNFRQSRAATGRFSITEPALQTLAKRGEEKDEQFKVRRAFVPREDYYFVECDYKNMEFRAAVAFARERTLAREIREGFDPHQAAANMAGITRDEAKTLNFLVLYGGGAQKLADSLRIPLEKAKEIRAKYFEGLPFLQRKIYDVTKRNKQQGFIRNLFGRVYYTDKDHSYKCFNYWDQGSCAEFVKFRMVALHNFLSAHKSRMVLQIHDSLLFEIHRTEVHLVPEIKKIMETGWPLEDILPMEVSSSWSDKSWADLIEGEPPIDTITYGTETRNQVQEPNTSVDRAPT